VAALPELLERIHARNALLHRTVVRGPWALRIADGSPLAVLAVVSGHAWVCGESCPPARVAAGEIAVICERGPYTVADSPGTRPDVVCLPGNRFATPDGVDITAAVRQELSAPGPPPPDATVLVCGTYDARSAVSRELLSTLPRLLTVPTAEVGDGVVAVLAAEVARDEPGRQVVLDRTLDLVLVLALRSWFRRGDAPTPAWYRAQHDPVVGPALRLIHDRPERPWTVASLAAQAGASRAWFARRFTDLLGEPPMSYLARWRLLRGADLLRDTDATIDAVARRVGYGSGFTFSVAFKRLMGVSPSAYRTGAPVAHTG
jgi:AraC-like DNA-binding protein